jgi:uncharacterized protein
MPDRMANGVVHLELHTRDRDRACEFYASLCGWPAERVAVGPRSYLAVDLGGGLGGGIVECRTERSLWLPYVEVSDVGGATERARRLGATVLLDSREGPAGWRSVVRSPEGGEIALWQPKGR